MYSMLSQTNESFVLSNAHNSEVNSVGSSFVYARGTIKPKGSSHASAISNGPDLKPYSNSTSETDVRKENEQSLRHAVERRIYDWKSESGQTFGGWTKEIERPAVWATNIERSECNGTKRDAGAMKNGTNVVRPGRFVVISNSSRRSSNGSNVSINSEQSKGSMNVSMMCMNVTRPSDNQHTLDNPFSQPREAISHRRAVSQQNIYRCRSNNFAYDYGYGYREPEGRWSNEVMGTEYKSISGQHLDADLRCRDGAQMPDGLRPKCQHLEPFCMQSTRKVGLPPILCACPANAKK
ncbi:unnamed protein product [Protopolystoma xenopodis]|uniref:Uncharacterized protein n=1 Tax=Protopolystoma xenopodis TaxID=117903 RepID=A0A448WDC9_9PLAT|nr:unnamed protein product [Protopolystoma xenopodis]